MPAGIAIGVFLTALIVRLVHLAQFKSSPFFLHLIGDSEGYDLWARQLAAGDWIGTGAFYQSPLYPYLLGVLYKLVGHDLLIVRLFQYVAGAAGCSLVALASARLFGPREGLISGLFLAFFAPAIFYDSLIQKASLDFFLSSLLVFLLAGSAESFSSRRYAAIGTVLGLLCLNRENALLLVPLLLFWAWRREQRARKSIQPLLLGMALVLTPVLARNLAISGEFQLTTSQLGPNLYIGNNEGADGTYRPLVAGRGSPEFERADATEIAQTSLNRTLRPGEVSRYWRNRALQWISSHPRQWLALTWRKLLLVWNAQEVMDSEDIQTHSDYSTVLRATHSIAHFGLLAPLALLGVWVSRSRWRELWIFHGVLILYSLSVALFFVLGRYRYPLVPTLALFVGTGAIFLVSQVKSRNWRRLLPAGALLAVLLVAMNVPLSSTVEMRALTRSNLARQLARSGANEEAIVFLRQALELTPEAPRLLSALGTALSEQGRFEEAKSLLERAISSDPNLPAAHNSLGTVHSAMGQLNRALDEFEAAVRMDPRNAAFAFNLGTALSVAGRLDEAIAQFFRAAELAPGNFNIRNNLGITLARTERLEESVRQFELATEIEPQNRDAARNLARARELLRVSRAAAGDEGTPERADQR